MNELLMDLCKKAEAQCDVGTLHERLEVRNFTCVAGSVATGRESKYLTAEEGIRLLTHYTFFRNLKPIEEYHARWSRK